MYNLLDTKLRRSIVEFFEKAFAWLADVSSKLPKVDFQIFFIAAAAILFGLGIVFAFTYLGSKSFKLIKASKKIQKYLEGVDTVDDDNVSDFTAHCFSAKAPQALRDSWVQYLGVRFGYPSDIVSDKNVYDKAVKKNKDYRAGIYLCVSLLLLAVFAFWGYGTLDKTSMGTVHFVCLVVIGLMYLFLILINRAQNKHCLEAFDAMQEDLDAKVNLQVEKNYATDSSPLSELAGMVEEIIARNTSKAIDVDEEQDAPQEPTPIEALIEQEEQGAPAEETTATEEEPVEETVAEEVEETPVEDVQEENQDVEEVEEQSDEDVAKSEQVEEDSRDEQVEEQSVGEQEKAEENVEDVQDEQEDVQEESVEENEELTEEPAEEEPQEEVVEEEAVEDTQESIEDAQDDENVEEIAEQSEETSEEVEENQEETVEEQPVDEEAVEEEQEDGAQAEDAQVFEDTREVDDASEDAVEEPAVEDEQGEEAQEVEQDVEDGSEETEEEQVAVEEQEEEQVEDESEDEQTEDESEEQETEEEADESDPEVVYVVDGDEEDDEVVKPAKLVKLPNLVDYMLSKNMPKAMKLQIASMLIATYKKFENSKEDRKIVVQCLTKVMRDLQK